MVRRPSGTGASFVPREVLQEPAQFGYLDEWMTPTPGVDERQVEAAQAQHYISWLLDRYLIRSRRSVAETARSLGMSPDKLYRLKRGETLLPFADLLALTRLAPSIKAGMTWYLEQTESIVPGDPFPILQRKPQPE